jgi:signal transduction histidine kinase
MRIRTRFFLFALCILIPAFLACILVTAYVYREAKESNRKSLRETTHALALLLDNDIRGSIELLEGLADSPALDMALLENFQLHARNVASRLDAGITVTDAAGKTLLDTSDSFGAVLVGDPEFATVTRSDKPGPRIGNMVRSPSNGMPLFLVTVPVMRENDARFYMTMAIKADRLQRLVDSQRLPEGWFGTIVDRRGVVMARSAEPGIYVGQAIRRPLLDHIQARPEGASQVQALSGEQVFSFFSHANESGYTFVVSVPQSEIDRGAFHAALLLGGMLALLLALTVLGAGILARRTVQPIEALRHAARQLGRGQPVVPAECGITEMDAVGMALVRASVELRSGKAELERQVAEAVAVSENSQRALLQAQKLEALGRLTGGIAHDFNNVLQTLTSGLQMAHLSSPEPRVKSLLDTCERAVRRAVDLTRQLMAFGRVQDGQIETIDTAMRINSMSSMMRGALPGGIEFQLQLATDLWHVTLDALQFELALLNLVINARDALPQGGSVRLDARNETLTMAHGELPAGDYVRLALNDTGRGMSEDILAKAIDPFFSTKDASLGAGLGLPQAYGFARQTGGTLMLRSAPGQGTEVILYLPRARALASAAREIETPSLRREHSIGRLLFVEDDVLVREVVLPALQRAGVAGPGAGPRDAALAHLEGGRHFDLVFSDIIMPGKTSGIALAELVVRHHPRTRVVLTTGYSYDRVDIPDIRTLSKPYSVQDVVQALNDALETAG